MFFNIIPCTLSMKNALWVAGEAESRAGDRSRS
jgi:hypothetical protein